MTWTAEQEAKYREREADLARLKIAIGQSARYDAALAAHMKLSQAPSSYVDLPDWLRGHGAELIALIEPFVKRG